MEIKRSLRIKIPKLQSFVQLTPLNSLVQLIPLNSPSWEGVGGWVSRDMRKNPPLAPPRRGMVGTGIVSPRRGTSSSPSKVCRVSTLRVVFQAKLLWQATRIVWGAN